jgi:CheY-like chemotaxis protein
MEGYVKLYEMLESALRQAGEEAGMLLGQSLSVTLTDALSFTKTAYFADLDDGVFVMTVESREEYPGQFYLLFSLRDAILMSSLLLGIPAPRIQEKRRLSIIETDDIDAFGEIGNMINGAMNTTFQASLSGKAHLKQMGAKKYVPEIDPISEDEPLPDGDYLMFRARLEMEGHEMHHLDLLIPVSLSSLYDPQPEAVPDLPDTKPEVEEKPEVKSETPSVSAPVQKQDTEDVSRPRSSAIAGTVGEDMIVIFEDDEQDRANIKEALGFTGFKIVEGSLNSDVKDFFSRGNVRMVIVGSQDADDRELAVCIKINALRQDQPVPVVMCALRWTRTAVLKALKYGARDIIIKPCDPDEISSKVKRLCRIPSA